MKSQFLLWSAAAAVLLASAVDAAPRKGKRPAKRPPAKSAPKSAPKPVVPPPTVTPGIMVPKPVILTKPTAAEAQAHVLWTLRAALNVAALQCQHSPFLRTVDNYNQMLRKHGGELTAAQTRMLGHYTRTMKRGGAAAFDRYNTRSYNSFSTMDAQYNFCWAAGQAGQAVRMADVGKMAIVAEAQLPIVRGALSFVPPAAGLIVPVIPIPVFSAPDPIEPQAGA